MANRTNDLDGRTWGRYSISIWSDIRKTPEEIALRHPAMFPMALAERLIECFTTKNERVVLDPFAGIGSAPLAAARLGGKGIGLEISPDFIALSQRRLTETLNAERSTKNEPRTIFHQGDAKNLRDFVPANSVDLVITSPPYWDILLQRRSADGKPGRHYGGEENDLGKIRDYADFLHALSGVFAQVYEVLRPGKYCCVIVMDLRKKNVFYPFHADLAAKMQDLGFLWDDLIIWDRRQEYNNLRPLGYPAVFRINKTHEYILIFQKPKS